MRAHGTHACYVWGPEPGPGDGCRCEPCKTANRRYEQERARRIEPAYVGADRARRHVTFLAGEGVGLKTVAKVSGVSQGALWKLMYGKRQPNGTQRPSKRIRRETEQAILSVTPAHGADGARVPAGPVWAMVDALVAAGVPKARIAERIGQTGPGLQLGRQVITRGHARAIKAMHDELVAGTLVTVRRSRRGVHLVAPDAEVDDTPRATYDLELVEALAEILEDRIDQSDWRADAACRNRPPYIWFPTRGDHQTLAAAKRICAACIVRHRCLEANLHVKGGVYGGTSESERRALRQIRLLDDAQAS